MNSATILGEFWSGALYPLEDYKERRIIALAELERVLLAELRKMPGCEGAARVTVIPRGGDHGWTHGPIRPGTADPSDCRAALQILEKRLRHVYGLKPDSAR